MQRILIIDDEKSARDLLRTIFEHEGYEVVEAINGQEGVEIFRKLHIDLVVTDMVMPVKDGLKTILELRQKEPTVPVIAISGGGAIAKEKYLNIASYFEGVRTLSKPFCLQDLLTAVEDLLGSISPADLPNN
jgi:CheY-like chemotaxis protein